MNEDAMKCSKGAVNAWLGYRSYQTVGRSAFDAYTRPNNIAPATSSTVHNARSEEESLLTFCRLVITEETIGQLN